MSKIATQTKGSAFARRRREEEEEEEQDRKRHAGKGGGLTAMHHAVDPKQLILEAIGDLSKFQVQGPNVLVVTYIRPAETASGLKLPDSVQAEDEYQGKVGLLVRVGPIAFKNTTADAKFEGELPQIGDWVSYSMHEGWACQIRRRHCRILNDTMIRMIVPEPDLML